MATSMMLTQVIGPMHGPKVFTDHSLPTNGRGSRPEKLRGNMRMNMIDLSNRTHVEALRFACERARDPRLFAQWLALGEAGTREQLEAGRAIASPTLAAELIRGVLAVKGGDVLCATPFGSGVFVSVTDPNAIFAVDRWIKTERIPSFCIALLDAKTAEEALEAIRKAGV